MMRRFVFMSALCVLPLHAASAAPFKLADSQIVRIGNGAEPRELDPAKATGVPESHILDNLFEGLTSLDPQTLKPVPGVAESWVIAKDGLTYKFNLRKNAKWSDGKAVTADDFVFSWTRALSKELASEYAYQLFYIKNAEAFNQGKLTDASKLGFKALNETTLEVVLEKPTPFFLNLLAFHTYYPVPKQTVANAKTDEWTKAGALVSNGPFMLAEWKLNQHIKLAPNQYYWNAALVKLKEAWIYPIESQDTEERNFFAGKLEKTNEVPVLKVPVYEKEKAKDKLAYHPYRADPYLGVYFYRLNVTKKPLDNPKVRRALNLAIDRKMLVENVTRSGEKVAQVFTPPGISSYTHRAVLPETTDSASLAEAKRLLAEAGYPDGKGFPKIEINFNTSDKHKKIALAIQQMLKKNLGIEVGLYNQEWKVYLDNQKKMNYQVQRAGWIGDYPDPNTFLDMWVTDGGNNKTGWSSKEYDKLVSDASYERDEKKRFATLQKAESILLSELPIIPIYMYTLPRLVSQKLKMQANDGTLIEYTANIQDRLFLKNMVIAR